MYPIKHFSNSNFVSQNQKNLVLKNFYFENIRVSFSVLNPNDLMEAK